MCVVVIDSENNKKICCVSSDFITKAELTLVQKLVQDLL